jgi:glycosyltransferase involved in cell wall biosynthesis
MARASADGVICIGGEDWWYHNRGHYDFQIMRRMGSRMPVLFVNSIGVRMPRLGDGGLFLKRVGRKLASLSRGVVHVENGFHVFSPLSVPGRLGRKATNWALAPQIVLAARRIGVRRPLLWIHCPPGADLVDRIGHAGLVFQRTDRFEAFPDGDRQELTRQVQLMKSRADLVVYCSHALMAEEADQSRRQAFIDHGVDYQDFEAAGLGERKEPDDIAALPRPRAVFVGGIDHHTFAPELFVKVAAALPEVHFPLIGGCSLPEGWCRLPNVHLLGRKPYSDVARYMAAGDVLLMPWNNGDWIKACNPVKLKEYLATGRPVVSTPFAELDYYPGLVHVAADAESFAVAIRRALEAPGDAAARRAFVRRQTWEAKVETLLEALAGIGIHIEPREQSAAAEAARAA